MKTKNTILIILVIMLITAVPILLFTYKLQSSKQKLHVDKTRYENVNKVCFENKNYITCEKMLNEDLEILLNAHKNNSQIIHSHLSILHPKRILKAAYKEQENISLIEPEILIKSLLLKKITFYNNDNQIKAGLIGEKIETYIIKNFSKENKSAYLNALEIQDKNFQEYSQKITEIQKQNTAKESTNINTTGYSYEF